MGLNDAPECRIDENGNPITFDVSLPIYDGLNLDELLTIMSINNRDLIRFVSVYDYANHINSNDGGTLNQIAEDSSYMLENIGQFLAVQLGILSSLSDFLCIDLTEAVNEYLIS